MQDLQIMIDWIFYIKLIINNENACIRKATSSLTKKGNI